MSTFTQGPWAISERWAYDVLADGIEVTSTYRSEIRDSEAIANARLIAAAPELLEACKLAEDNSLHLPRFVRDTLEAAISKAEGQPPASPDE